MKAKIQNQETFVQQCRNIAFQLIVWRTMRGMPRQNNLVECSAWIREVWPLWDISTGNVSYLNNNSESNIVYHCYRCTASCFKHGRDCRMRFNHVQQIEVEGKKIFKKLRGKRIAPTHAVTESKQLGRVESRQIHPWESIQFKFDKKHPSTKVNFMRLHMWKVQRTHGY